MRKNCWVSDMELSQLQQIYADYEKALAQAHKRSSVFAGIFGQGSLDDARNDPCNREFLEKSEAWIAAFAASEPEIEPAENVCLWILDAARNHRNRPVYWHYLVAQGYLKMLIPVLPPESCRKLALEFNRQYPKRIRLPIQEEVYRCLTERYE